MDDKTRNHRTDPTPRWLRTRATLSRPKAGRGDQTSRQKQCAAGHRCPTSRRTGPFRENTAPGVRPVRTLTSTQLRADCSPTRGRSSHHIRTRPISAFHDCELASEPTLSHDPGKASFSQTCCPLGSWQETPTPHTQRDAAVQQDRGHDYAHRRVPGPSTFDSERRSLEESSKWRRATA